MSRSISAIAESITADFANRGKPVPFGAVPYVQAMYALTTIDDMYYADDAETVLIYALSNLTSWRGEVAREVKAEMKALMPKR